MSIYSSLAAPDDGDHVIPGCASYVEHPVGFWEFSGLPCDCGQPDAPLVYQGSHIVPDGSDERGGSVHLALIPSHVTRDGRDDQPEDGAPWPFLRFGVNESTVVLTRPHVEQIVESLSQWLDALDPEVKLA